MSVIWLVIKAWFAWFILAPLCLVGIGIGLAGLLLAAVFVVDTVETWARRLRRQ